MTTPTARTAERVRELRDVVAHWERRQREAQRALDAVNESLERTRATLAKAIAATPLPMGVVHGRAPRP